MSCFARVAGTVALACVVLSGAASATIPYGAGGPVGPGVPGFGPGLTMPPMVPGKEYSHDSDTMITAVGVAPDAQQVVAWDGSGGVADGLDYTGTRPSYTPEDEVDAIANHGDFAFNQLLDDVSHLVFSVDDTFTGYSGGAPFPGVLPSAGPIVLPIGTIGGAGELSYELGAAFAPPSTFGLWAPQPAINGMPVPDDVDGVEVWGPEPAFTADADKYSLDMDILSFGSAIPGDAVSVWNLSGSPYVPHSLVVGLVTGLLGPPPTGAPIEESINIDALMVHDVVGDPDEFERDPGGPAGGPGDLILFSIRQIVDPSDPSGYYATGSELFVMDAAGLGTFLAHGGHLWDKAFALSAFDIFTDPLNHGVIDINAIEAVGSQVVPEPAGVALVILVLCGLGIAGRRRCS